MFLKISAIFMSTGISLEIIIFLLILLNFWGIKFKNNKKLSKETRSAKEIA